MYTTYKNYRALLFLLIAVVSNYSCKKFVDIAPPETQVSSATVFSNDQIATSAMVGLYSKMMNGTGFLNGNMSCFAGLNADDLSRGSALAMYDVFLTNSITINNSTVSSIWTTGYNYIYQANAILEGVSKSIGISSPVKNQLTGEASFIRALTYFYFVNLFGDVPLVVNTDYDDNAFLPRTPTNTVYDQIITDLVTSATLLPTTYVTTSAYPTARVRPNKWAAKALLARVYLYRKEYAKAEAAAEEVISSGTYNLGNASNVFLATSSEAIWQLLPVSTGSNTAEGNLFIPLTATAIPGFTLPNSLVVAFETGDVRKTNWIKSQVVNSQTYYYPYKYKVRTGGAPYTEYNTVLRLAEQYLIRAEARAQQNKLSSAVDDINVIRTRAGVSPLSSTLTQAQVLAAIEKERLLEFFAEWGHRWLDLKRTDRATPVLAPIKGSNWQPTDVLWPIPFTQLQLNSALIQNPGY